MKKVLLLIALFFICSDAFGTDELSLRGVIKAVDSTAKNITVDVMSESCFGIRSFNVDTPSIFYDKINKEVSFQIDKSTCKSKGKVMPKIMWLEGRRL